MYTEEDLLEAASILMEEYDLDEDEAINMIAEAIVEIEIDGAINILVEEYGFDEDEAINMINETFMDDMEDTYEGLKKDNPSVAGAIKGATYAIGGTLGGAAYGIHKARRAKREGKKSEKHPIIKGAAKGLGYRLLGLVGAPNVVVPAAVGGVRSYVKSNNKYKEKERKTKKNINKKENKKIEEKAKSKNKKLKENIEIFYTEEELLEAVDILIEEYGINEEEAIDMMVSEAYKLNKNNMQGTHNLTYFSNRMNTGKTEEKANKMGVSNIYFNTKHAHHDKETGEFSLIDHGSNKKSYDQEKQEREKINNTINKIDKGYGKVRNAALAANSVAFAAGGAYLAHKAYKKHKAKKENAKNDLKNKKRK